MAGQVSTVNVLPFLFVVYFLPWVSLADKKAHLFDGVVDSVIKRQREGTPDELKLEDLSMTFTKGIGILRVSGDFNCSAGRLKIDPKKTKRYKTTKVTVDKKASTVTAIVHLLVDEMKVSYLCKANMIGLSDTITIELKKVKFSIAILLTLKEESCKGSADSSIDSIAKKKLQTNAPLLSFIRKYVYDKVIDQYQSELINMMNGRLKEMSADIIKEQGNICLKLISTY